VLMPDLWFHRGPPLKVQGPRLKVQEKPKI
jgi:hypothetical protein